ncbi:hypothetical protein Q1695_015810 [Nippostrongylus brasiliensis]|nr:hypothetical protein Q1695_015810 [Nippostrongylus brasiliensis]
MLVQQAVTRLGLVGGSLLRAFVFCDDMDNTTFHYVYERSPAQSPLIWSVVAQFLIGLGIFFITLHVWVSTKSTVKDRLISVNYRIELVERRLRLQEPNVHLIEQMAKKIKVSCEDVNRDATKVFSEIWDTTVEANEPMRELKASPSFIHQAAAKCHGRPEGSARSRNTKSIQSIVHDIDEETGPAKEVMKFLIVAFAVLMVVIAAPSDDGVCKDIDTKMCELLKAEDYCLHQTATRAEVRAKCGETCGLCTNEKGQWDDFAVPV